MVNQQRPATGVYGWEVPSPSSSASRGGVVVLVGQGCKLGIQLVGLVIMARLLTPEDFGLVAMVAVVMAIADLFRDFGMSTAALQARDLSHQQASNLFWVSATLGVGASLAVAASTPLLVAVFGEPRLYWITPACALPLLVNSLQVPVQVQLARKFRFVGLAVTDVAAQLVALALAVGSALAGWAYWALVVQLVAAAVILLVTRWLIAHWAPSCPRRGHHSLALVKAGGHIGGAQALGYISTNVDNLMIGSVWGATDLGHYSNAYKLQSMPIGGLMAPLTTVVIPALNRARDAGRDTVHRLLTLQVVVGLGVAWLYAIGAATASEVIHLTLGKGWEPAVPIFMILCLGSSIHGLSFVNYWVYLHTGETRGLLESQFATKPISVAMVVGAAFISVEAVAWAYNLGLAFTWIFATWYMGRKTGWDTTPFFVSGIQVLAVGWASFAVTAWCLAMVEPSSVGIALGLGVTVATLSLGVFVAVLPGLRTPVLSIGSLRSKTGGGSER
jgi:PST family polysaccharide transporter